MNLSCNGSHLPSQYKSTPSRGTQTMLILLRPLAYFNRNPKEFSRRFVTMDEIWIHQYTLESCEGSQQWVENGESAPKHPKTQQSAGKVMASVFWDIRGVIFIDYLEEGRTITGAYYAALLDQLVDEISKKRLYLKKKKSFFMMTIHHLTHRKLHIQKSMNWVSNHFRIDCIL